MAGLRLRFLGRCSVPDEWFTAQMYLAIMICRKSCIILETPGELKRQNTAFNFG